MNRLAWASNALLLAGGVIAAFAPMPWKWFGFGLFVLACVASGAIASRDLREARRAKAVFDATDLGRAMRDGGAPLGGEKYINLETFRKDGTGVKTPVWCAGLAGKLVAFSAGSAYKVKRIRNDARVRAAACDVRGNVRGEWLSGNARVLDDPAEAAGAHRALRAKYGFAMAMTDFFAGLTGRKQKRAYLEITLSKPR
jgi:PPOX class probable F420-dependent enzyme